MKKIILPVAAAALVMMSCGGSKEEKKEEGPALCDCVNIKGDADEKTKEACEKMKAEYKEKYDNASDEEKKKIQEEVAACEGK